MDSNIKKLLQKRTYEKKRKPKFRRVQGNQFDKLAKKSWRKPRGSGNKVRLLRRGKPKRISCGYRSPKKVRGLQKLGLLEKIVVSVEDLENIDKKKVQAKILRTLGGRKRIILLKKAKELKLTFSNVKNIDEAIKKIEEKLKTSSKKKTLKKQEKTKKLEESKKSKKKTPAKKVSESSEDKK